ncbi:hypothetical protein E3N88_16948 [Mikania micrantha]|uniref:Aminotransferase-like plant mobile domain-containing protein n=1 Tax=Mikania micrantha TaxID=192012 RepID=A0A5N6NQE4_9ASTR|nr:hypothetical protein E3N88_16948 [Mikania micrantha]
MSYDLHPGPIVDDVLFHKDSHRARDIFNNKELKNLVFRRADQKFFSLFNNPITENVKRYVNIAGFGGLLDCGYRNLDHGLFEALIERWRPETHTFHLPIGEATVTLEDVNVLWGLPIEGGVVSGCEQPSSVADRILRCHTLLGIYVKQHRAMPTTLVDQCIYCSCGHGVESLLLHQGFYIHLIIEDHMFKWRPYEEVISLLPEICTSGIRSWQSECYVIYWDVVEFYTPQRVMRQFGMVQHIPSPFPLSINDHMKLHTLTRSGKPERNWMNTHSEYTDGISQTYQQAGGFMQTDSTSNFHNFELLQNTANQVMGMVNEGSRLRYPTQYQTEPVNLGGDDTEPRSLRRRERRRGNVRSGAGIQSNIMFEHNNEQDVYTPHASMLPLFNQSQSEDFNYYAPQFSPNETHGFSGISPPPSLDLNLQMSVGEWDDDTLLAHTLNTEDVDQNQIASRRRNPWTPSFNKCLKKAMIKVPIATIKWQPLLGVAVHAISRGAPATWGSGCMEKPSHIGRGCHVDATV